MNGSVNAIEAASRRLSNGPKLLQAVEDIKERRRLAATDVGRLIGLLDKAMQSAAADRAPHHRAILDIVRDKVIGDVVGQICGCCGWTIRDEIK
jgi:hypothetical protein